jgi:glucose uptake protein GlcU
VNHLALKVAATFGFSAVVLVVAGFYWTAMSDDRTMQTYIARALLVCEVGFAITVFVLIWSWI